MRKGFNWSLLDRNELYCMLYSAGQDIIGQKLKLDVLHSRLSRHIKSNLPVSIKKQQYDSTQVRGYPYMGGTYYSELDRKGSKRFIEIILSYHPQDREIKITEYRWRRLCLLFADTILHEMIHMRQYRSRNFKEIPGYESTAELRKKRVDQEYYGHRDEMGAHSFNIACEMIDRFGYHPAVISNYMDTMPRSVKNPTFARFLKTFDHDHNHIKVRQMKQKVLKQLENAAEGRPFKSNNHLTY